MIPMIGVVSQGGGEHPLPPVEANLKLYLDDLVNDGTYRNSLDDWTTITQWDDVSGNNNHAISGGTSFPNYNKENNSIYLNTTGYLTFANNINLVNGTLFIVLKVSWISPERTVQSVLNNTINDARLVLDWNTTKFQLLGTETLGDPTSIELDFYSGFLVITTNVSSSSAYITAEGWNDNSTSHSTPIFNLNRIGHDTFRGEIKKILFYDRVLSAAEKDDITLWIFKDIIPIPPVSGLKIHLSDVADNRKKLYQSDGWLPNTWTDLANPDYPLYMDKVAYNKDDNSFYLDSTASMANKFWPAIDYSIKRSIFIVSRSNTPVYNTDSTMWSFGKIRTTNSNLIAYIDTSQNFRIKVGTSTQSYWLSASGADDTNINLMTVYSDPDAAQYPHQSDLIFNFNETNIDGNYTGAYTLQQDDGYCIGGELDEVGNTIKADWEGYVYEFLVYENLSQIEVERVEQWLMDKYLRIPTYDLYAHYGDLVNNGIERNTLAAGTQITQWDDMSGKVRNMIQQDIYPVPTLHTDLLGLEVIGGSGGTKTLIYSNGILNTISHIFAVIVPSGTTYKSYLNLSGIRWRTSSNALAYSEFGTIFNAGLNTVSGKFDILELQTDADLINSKYYLSNVYNPSNGTSIEFIVTVPGFQLSSAGGGSGRFYIYELIIYPRGLSIEERINVVNYLGTKYGIPINQSLIDLIQDYFDPLTIENLNVVYDLVVDFIQTNPTNDDINAVIDYLQKKKEGQPQEIIDRINDIIELLL